MSTEISEKHEKILRHMLGADSRYKKKEWGFRNRFCADKGHADYSHLKQMESLGLVKSGESLNNLYFWATKKGALAIGFKPYQLRNAGLSEG